MESINVIYKQMIDTLSAMQPVSMYRSKPLARKSAITKITTLPSLTKNKIVKMQEV